MELDRDVLGAGDLQNARCFLAVKGELAVCEIGNEQNVVFTAERDSFLVKLERRYGTRRIVRVIEDEERCTVEHVSRNRRQIGQKSAFTAKRHKERLTTDESGRASMYRIVDVGHERDRMLVGKSDRGVGDP